MRAALPRRSQDERSAETRRKVIAATIALIREGGYACATTLAIAERAGVSRGAMQHQFRTRYDVLAAVADQLTSEMLDVSAEIGAHSESLEQRVAAAVRRYWDAYTSRSFFAVLDIHFGTRNEPKLHARLRRYFTNVEKSSDEPWFALFSGLGVPERELEILRRHTMATLRGYAVASFLGLLRGPLDEQLAYLQTLVVARLRSAGTAGPELRLVSGQRR